MSNHIKEFTQEQKDAAKLGAEGGLGLVAGTVGRMAKAFGNTAKQYLKGLKKPQPKSNFKPFHRGGRVYDRQAINDAFKARFGPQANPAIRPPKIQGTNFGRADAQVKMREAYRSLKK